MVMLMVIPMFVALGLVVDVGWAYYTRQAMHGAAESAAMAAAQYALDGLKAGGTYTCGSQGLRCYSDSSPYSCPSTIPSSITTTVDAACAYAATNGFTNGGSNSQTVTVSANTTSPPTAVPGVSVKYWISAHITQNNPLTFGAVLGSRYLKVGARATAALVQIPITNCVTALDPTASQAISITGNANISMSCGIADDSNSSSALSLVGNITLNTTGIQVVGGASQVGNIVVSPSPTTNAQSVPDPFANVPEPSYTPPPCNYSNPNIVGNTTITLSPGSYCGGISITGNANITFSPGTYVLVGGGLNATGNVTLTGSGVTFYNTFNTASGYPYSPINLTGNLPMTLSAPTSGPLQGMLFFQDRNAPTGKTESITGNSTSNFTGAVYFPNSTVTYTGNSGASTQDIAIVADKVNLVGNASLQANPNNPASPSAPKVALIE